MNILAKSIALYFLLTMFLLGAYFSANVPPRDRLPTPVLQLLEGFDNIKHDSADNDTVNAPDQCPNVLVRRGETLVLHSTKNPEVLPLTFHSMDEYVSYLENNRSKTQQCPVLFLQQECNAQGEDVFRVRPTLDATQNGLPPTTYIPGVVLAQTYGDNDKAAASFRPARPIPGDGDSVTASTAGSAAMFNSFDAYGQNVGTYTTLDALHNSGAQQYASPNAMDPNWGGSQFSNTLVESGAYEGNYVTRPVYPRVAVA